MAEKRVTYGDEVAPGSEKAGVVWHTQGSDSMCCSTGQLLQQPDQLKTGDTVRPLARAQAVKAAAETFIIRA